MNDGDAGIASSLKHTMASLDLCMITMEAISKSPNLVDSLPRGPRYTRVYHTSIRSLELN